MPRSLRSRHATLIAVSALALLVPALSGCRPARPSGGATAGDTGDTVDTGEVQPASAALLLRGRISPDTLILEPVFGVASAGATDGAGAGPHRLMGFDDAGAILFDVRFAGTPVSAGDVTEEHFQLTVPITSERAARIHRIELRAGDGRTTARTTTHSPAAFAEALAADDAVIATRTSDQLVSVTWDAARFPVVMIMHPQSGAVLAIGRGGRIDIATDLSALDVNVSDGIHSGTRLVDVRSRS